MKQAVIPPLEFAIGMIRGLARIGRFAFGMTLSLDNLLENEDNLIIERACSLLDCCVLGDGAPPHVAMTVCCLANK